MGAIGGFKIELDCIHTAYDDVDYSALHRGMFNVMLEYPSVEDETFDRVNQMLERIFFSDRHIPTRFTEDHDD